MKTDIFPALSTSEKRLLVPGYEIEKIIRNCIPCILSEKQRGKQEDLLCSMEKGEVPFYVYYIDHLRPLPSVHKQYRYIFLVVDAFAKLCGYMLREPLIPTIRDLWKSAENNIRRGTTFASRDFEDYCKSEAKQHSFITTGVLSQWTKGLTGLLSLC